MQLEIGMKMKKDTMVTDENCSDRVGSGSLKVFGTPAMIGLMENAALNLAQTGLDAESTTVGISINVVHTASTPLGCKVEAEAELVGIEGKKLVFKLSAKDEQGMIGEGMHERIVINIARFMEKANAKRN